MQMTPRRVRCSFPRDGDLQSDAGGFAGEDLPGVHKALDYLIGNVNEKMVMLNLLKSLSISRQDSVVLGGGDMAMDCVRTAVRQRPSRFSVCTAETKNMPTRVVRFRMRAKRALNSFSTDSLSA